MPSGALCIPPHSARSRSVERLRTLLLAEPRTQPAGGARSRAKLEPDVGRALMNAPAISECRDQRQSTAPHVLRTSFANLVFEPAALVGHLAADDAIVEL